MTNFSKSSLISQNKVNDEKANQMENPIGILALFHRKGTTGGTQRLIVEKSSILEIQNSTSDTKDDALARIDQQIRKNASFDANLDLAYALVNYLPHTQSWSMREKLGGTDEVGFIINFDVDRVGICTRQVLAMDIESWKSTSTEEQILHQSNSSMMGNFLKAVPTETVLTEEQKEERRKAVKRAKGLRDYYYGNEVVWAINKKMADKKARKMGLV
jgi:hypothetical protein